MNTTGKSYASYAGRLEGFVDNLPRTVMVSPALDNLSSEERVKFSKALQALIDKELPRVQELRPV